jgi:predicted flap endonuclease-1-like 5' DNA nuclease/archaellum component FlaC
MIALALQMVVCLLVAAAIGVAVGWLLRNRAAESHAHRLTELETELRVKGQALDAAIYELKVKTSAVMALESKVSSLESLGRSAQEEVASWQDRIDRLQHELKESQARSESSRSEFQTQLERLADQETTLAAYANEVRQANAARSKAQQELTEKEQEVADLHQQVLESDKRRDELEQLRMKLEELEPAQGRVHWLEVQLSEREAHHRHLVHQLEKDLATRDHRLAEQTEQTRLLTERDVRISSLEQRLAQLHALQAELAGQAKIMGDQEEEISRLRKRLGEVRAALRVQDDGGSVVARPNGPANQLTLQISPSKASAGPRKDDLKKIQGISPAIERALNKMGTFSYVQIARWKSSDIARVAKKLDGLPGRAKPDHWIAGAKKQHREKYGEKP